ncbi:MAG: YbbC/YhhH family protein [Candidatus Azobacteroides sp.]|nr:YbbC/YhhH family protein [Candidatus Azobacteroides sp.]
MSFILNTNLSSDNYSEITGYFPDAGFIPNEEIAFKIAEIVLTQIYGKENINEGKPFSINLENDIWIIEGTLYRRKGGVAYMEIQKKDGKILKIIHTK